MPTGQHRAWSTQYGEDFRNRDIKWNHLKKKSNNRRTYRPQVPRATEIVLPQYVQAYTEECYGLDDPMLDGTVLNNEQGLLFPTVNCFQPVTTYLNGARDVQFLSDDDDVHPEMPLPETGLIHVPGEAEPVIPEAQPIRSKTPDLHWICWPEPKRSKTPKRPYTSQGLCTERTSLSRNDKPLNVGQPVKFDPKIKSWTNVTVENDRKAVDAMFTTMKRSQTFYEPMYKPMTSISVNDPPPKDKYTKYGGQVVDPRSLYQQNFSPYYQPHGTGPRDAMHLQELSREMNQSQSPAFNYHYSFNKYPLHMRKNKRTAATDDYVHERSMFMTTTPNCVGHFIIHPDWVSERSSLRRSKSMLQLSSSSKY